MQAIYTDLMEKVRRDEFYSRATPRRSLRERGQTFKATNHRFPSGFSFDLDLTGEHAHWAHPGLSAQSRRLRARKAPLAPTLQCQVRRDRLDLRDHLAPTRQYQAPHARLDRRDHLAPTRQYYQDRQARLDRLDRWDRLAPTRQYHDRPGTRAGTGTWAGRCRLKCTMAGWTRKTGGSARPPGRQWRRRRAPSMDRKRSGHHPLVDIQQRFKH